MSIYFTTKNKYVVDCKIKEHDIKSFKLSLPDKRICLRLCIDMYDRNSLPTAEKMVY